MFCKNCGTQVQDGQGFCPNCGASTAEAAPLQSQQQPQYQPQMNQPQKPAGGDGKGLSIAALVLGICGIVLSWIPVINLVVLACGILGIIFGYLGRKKSIAAYGKASGIATAGFILGIIGTSICGIGVLSCTVCPAACTACGTNAVNNAFSSYYF